MKEIDLKIIKDLQTQISKSLEDSMGDTCPYCCDHYPESRK